MKFSSVCFAALLFLATFSCKPSGSASGDKVETDSFAAPSPKLVELISPSANSVFVYGNTIYFKAGNLSSGQVPDSVSFLIDGRLIGTISKVSDSLVWNSDGAKLGNRNAEVIGFYKGEKNYDRKNFFLKYAKAPIFYAYKVVNTFPHDKTAYTQGLVYDKGAFYEGTGVYDQSTLRKADVTTGKLQKSFNLPENVFGEGIAVFDNRIIQITWQEQVAFLYDKETFQLLNKYYYPIQEGWGLTYDGKNLIMSDGSSNLYFMDKEYFTQIDKIEVFDNNGPVNKLNELEFINGEIWANVYTTDTIVRINPSNGAVIGKIVLSGLLKPEDRRENAEVLNGIAFDKEQNRIFVTGKYWPKLFQILVYPVKSN